MFHKNLRKKSEIKSAWKKTHFQMYFITVSGWLAATLRIDLGGAETRAT